MSARWWAPYVQALLAAILLAVPALLNRGPIYYEDTQVYLGRPAAVLYQLSGGRIDSEWVKESKIAKWERSRAPAPADPWVAGRSPFWGVVAYVFVLLLGGWGIVVMNALAAGTVLSLTWHRFFEKLPQWLFPGLVLGLALVSPLGPMVAFTTPDVFSGLLVFSITLLAIGWRRLLVIDRAVLTLVAVFAVISHDSHLALAALMTPAAALIAWKTRRAPPQGKGLWAATLAAPVLAGIVVAVTFSLAAKAFTGDAPLRLPHLTAQISSLPPGQRFLREHCDTQSFAVCAHADKLPVHWISFLFDKSPETGIYGPALIGERQRLSSEQYRFAYAVAREYPMQLTTSLTGQMLTQIGTLDLDDLNQHSKQRYFQTDYPPEVLAQIRGSMLWTDPGVLWSFNRISTATAIIGSALLAALFLLSLTRTILVPDRIILFAVVMLIGLLANAIVCGVLASPLGRFQARIIWIVPFLALTIGAFAALRGAIPKRGVIYVPSS